MSNPTTVFEDKCAIAYGLLNSANCPAYYISAPNGASVPFVVYTVDREAFSADNIVYDTIYYVDAELYKSDTDVTSGNTIETSLTNSGRFYTVDRDENNSQHITVDTYRFKV